MSNWNIIVFYCATDRTGLTHDNFITAVTMSTKAIFDMASLIIDLVQIVRSFEDYSRKYSPVKFKYKIVKITTFLRSTRIKKQNKIQLHKNI